MNRCERYSALAVNVSIQSRVAHTRVTMTSHASELRHDRRYQNYDVAERHAVSLASWPISDVSHTAVLLYAESGIQKVKETRVLQLSCLTCDVILAAVVKQVRRNK